MFPKILVSIWGALSLAACIGKPLQPPPPMFKSYIKNGAGEEEVKQAMLQCGYPNVSGGDKGDTNNDVAMRENCMFEKGFRYRSGYKGICSLRGQQDLGACK